MTRAEYNGVSLEIPTGWEDNSLITLLGPAPAPQRLMSVKAAAGERPNLILKRAHVLGQPVDLDGLADVQEEMMREAGHQVEVLERGEILIDPDGAAIRALTRDFRLAAGSNILQQVHFFWQVGEQYYVMVGTGMMDHAFPALREQFVRTAQGLRFRKV